MLALVTDYYGKVRSAGMLGYVQIDSCKAWSGRIKKKIEGDPPTYHAIEPVDFSNVHVDATEPVFRSQHKSPGGAEMEVTHTLLACG